MFLALFGAADAFGFDYLINGVYYSMMGGDSVKVTYVLKGNNNSSAYSGNVTIPSTVRCGGVNCRVVSIGDSAFYACTGLTGITMPNTIRTIGKSAFHNCDGLTSISLPDSCLTRIADHAFYDCDYLTSIVIPEGITEIEPYVFYYNSRLASVTLPAGLTKIGSYAFYYCDFINIVLPNSVDTIEDHAFYNSDLQAIVLHNNVKYVGYLAFKGTDISVPIYNDKIFAYLPSNSTYANYTIPDGITTISEGAAYSNTYLSSITIPGSVKTIMYEAFRGCYYITTINLSVGLDSIGNYAFSSCSNLANLSIPKTVRRIGQYAFSGCSGLTRIDLHPITPPAFGNYCFNSVPGNFFVSCDSIQPYRDALANVNIVSSRVTSVPYSFSSVSTNPDQGSVSVLEQPSTCPDSLLVLQATATYGSSFDRWSDGSTANPRSIILTEDTVVNAIFKYNEYEVSCIHVNGSVTGAGTFEYGTQIMLHATANDHYHFVKWNNGSTNPTLTHTVHNDTVIVAYFDIDKFVIVFANYDNSELQRDTLNYGTMPVYRGATPTRPSRGGVVYTFKCWSETIDTAVCNKRYIALYDSTVSRHRILFVNYDGSVLQRDTLNYGQMPAYRGTTPTKPATAQYTYTFKRWNPALAIVTKDTTYVAQYDSVVRKYTITFVNYNGATLQTKQVNYGATPTYTGTTPTKPSTAQYTYTFKGWNPAITAVTGAATYTAQYDSTAVNLYLIRFVNYDGTVLQSSNLPLGATPSYTGTTPTKSSTAQYTYTFKGWYPAVAAVTGAATYTAQYDSVIRQYAITFVNYNGTTLQTKQVNYGATPTYTGATPTKPSTAQYTYTFKCWNPTITSVTGNATYTAQYDSVIRQYAITFVNYNGTTLQTKQVNYGAMPTYTGATPTKPSSSQYTYSFKGWYPSLTAVTGAATYTAQYDSTLVATYLVQFVNYNGSVLQTNYLPMGATPQYTGVTPTKPATAKYTYTFKGWSPAITAVTGAATYTAQYDSVVNKYTVTVTCDTKKGTVTGGGTFDYGTQIQLSATPNPGYQFVNWSNGQTTPQITITVTGNMTLTANFQGAHYQVSTKINISGRGTVTGDGSYEGGTQVTLVATPNEGYEFTCWSNGETSNVMSFIIVSDTTFTANFISVATDVENVFGPNYIVYTQGKSVVVHGATDKSVFVYDLYGKVVAVEQKASDDVSFVIPVSGVYLIKIDDSTTIRVVVK